ncbi:hypothetical protein J7E81_21860 [Bacillus sp. ISL-18]|uniref:hypothetical protein n=1 Tax=Bacillus sp. ISL-18 TaxID=2819118 RepID=UPI001BE5419A|nr:hypothetical protein [Bacillus sp. ISL-18]MBT2657851.1 hypothetical protein [Bacillus sp. ISL-18]
MSKKAWLTGGMAALLTFGGLAGCGDGVDSDNGISDGQQKDAVDQKTKNTSNDSLQQAKKNIEDIQKDVEKKLKEKGVGDGVDQDNGINDGQKKDQLDSL